MGLLLLRSLTGARKLQLLNFKGTFQCALKQRCKKFESRAAHKQASKQASLSNKMGALGNGIN